MDVGARGRKCRYLVVMHDTFVHKKHSNSFVSYKNSSWGWNRTKKKRELGLRGMQYIVAYNKDDGGPAAFCSFIKTSEMDKDNRKRHVLYCYELQVHKKFQGLGLGTMLLQLLEDRAKSLLNDPLVMLTCFAVNQKALCFYNKHNYHIDAISPTDQDYIIMSKSLQKNHDRI